MTWLELAVGSLAGCPLMSAGSGDAVAHDCREATLGEDGAWLESVGPETLGPTLI